MPPSDILLIFVAKLLSTKYDFSSLQIKIHSILKIMFRLVFIFFIWLCILFIHMYILVSSNIVSWNWIIFLWGLLTIYGLHSFNINFLWISSLTFCDCNQLKWSKNSQNKCFNIHTFSSEEMKKVDLKRDRKKYRNLYFLLHED